MPYLRKRGLIPVTILFLATPLIAQEHVRKLISTPINEKQLVTIHNRIHPLAQARYDVGSLPNSFALHRMLLLLNRPDEREADLQRFLHDVQNRKSLNYHHWMTPQTFGQRFGPADSDIQTVKGWLQSHGFAISRVTTSKTMIEFSGTAGQLQEAFHTELHQYFINGEMHYANSSNPSIPVALVPAVKGLSPLHDFRAKPLIRNLGPASYSPTTNQAKIQWTISNPNGTGNFYAFAPEDFATQYDLHPLYQEGVNGSGETIGIINVANIDLGLVANYRQLFGLSTNIPQVVIDGNDPGGEFPNNVEAFLDVELSGAVAPDATIYLYISDGATLFDPLIFAALRAIEDNQASVLSVSFGSCEQDLGRNGNQLFSALWQQAAAQGQTVLVSSGDTGSAGCDSSGFHNAFDGLAVNGIASTPWDIAVGGTDFYYSDYASGAPSAASHWNQTNNPNNGSLVAPLAEQVWNDVNGLNANPLGLPGDIAAGGGASACAVYTNGCSGYPKPNWQSGLGVPTDGVRDLPDVSLFAADGLNLSAYPICVLPGDCVADSKVQTGIFLVGGTSGSAPAMAGIMALINQKYGRQGQAAVVLYPLAQQSPNTFHDITSGGNNVPITPTSQYYFATPGYDQASGLGSIDATALVNNWTSIDFLSTNTTLALSNSSITHGQSLHVSTSVKPVTGSGTPTGSVAVLTDSPLSSNQSQFAVTLANGAASGNVNFLPGGTYHVFANYGGDDVFGMSRSSPVVLTVKPENANLNFAALQAQSTGVTVVPNGGTVPYGSLLTLGVQPTGVSAGAGATNGIATGTATFKVDSTTQAVPLDSIGLATWVTPTLAQGAHSASASYSGDSSFNTNSSSPLSFTVTEGQPMVFLNSSDLLVGNLRAGNNLTVGIEVRAPFPGIGSPPTGTVKFTLGNISQTATLEVINNYESAAMVTIQNLGAGCYNFPSASYSGDSNWLSAGNGIDGAICVSPGPDETTTTTVIATPSSISNSQTASLTVTVAGSSGAAQRPTGYIDFYDNGAYLFSNVLPPPSSGTSTSIKVSGIYSSEFLKDGANKITALYSGDCCYSPSLSAPAIITAASNGPNFTLAPQRPQVLVKTGSSGTVDLNLSSLNQFNAMVDLSCTTSSPNVSCGLSPSSLALNGSATTTLNITVAAASSQVPSHRSLKWLASTGAFLFGSFCLSAFSRKRRWIPNCTMVLCTALLLTSCGSGSSSISPPTPPNVPPALAPSTTYYTVSVTGKANGIVHASQVIVSVQ